jgi:nucleotide-binding universal stress UspA family protein
MEDDRIEVMLVKGRVAPMSKLLVAIDSSDAAASAVRAGEKLAAESGGEILLLHVVDPSRVLPPPEVAHTYQPALAELRRSGQALLNETRLRITANVAVRLLMLEGDPADTIVGTAQREGADTIVIGTDSRGRLAHFLLGSTADSVIRRATCPVLTVRREAAPDRALAIDR